MLAAIHPLKVLPVAQTYYTDAALVAVVQVQ
jgi:hypothetical protein